MSKRHRKQRRQQPPTGNEIRSRMGLAPLSVMGEPVPHSGSTMTCVLEGGDKITFEPVGAMWMIGSGWLRHDTGAEEGRQDERVLAAMLLAGMESAGSPFGDSVDELIASAQRLVAMGVLTEAGLDLPDRPRR